MTPILYPTGTESPKVVEIPAKTSNDVHPGRSLDKSLK